MPAPRHAHTLTASTSNTPRRFLMRAAAVFAGSIIAIGLYMLVGAALAVPVPWIGLGMVAIMLVAAASVVATAPAPSTR
jgi:energy-converting hydrogenase Eha subunit A